MKLRNMLKMGAGALAVNFLRKKIPLNVMLSVTNRCTCACSYCGIPGRVQKELSTHEIRGLINQITEMGCQRLGLWGGEPLVREDIAEIIDYARARGLFVTMDSNGYLLPRKISALKNLDHLVLALDGDRGEHDLNRGQGSFERVMSAIEAASGRIPFWTITVLTKNNLGSLDFILAKAREYNFLATFQLLHHNNKLSRNQQELLPPHDDYARAIKKLIREKKRGAPIASSLTYLQYLLDWPDYSRPTCSSKVKGLNCLAAAAYCNVDTDGSVYPCSLLVEDIAALNFLDVGFKKAFESLRLGSCKGCLASCYVEYNSIFSLNPCTILDWSRSIRKAGG